MDFRSPIRVVSPRLEGDVLQVLAAVDAEFTGRQVHARVDHSSPEGVRQALKRLVQHGIVEQRGAGRALLYRFNKDHVAAPWIEGLTSLRQQVVERMRREIGAWNVQPVVAALFGSAARGQAGTQSDLDVFFVRPTSADADVWDRQLADFAEKATRWTGNDARPMDMADLELGTRPTGEPVLADIIEHGIILAGSMHTLRRLTRG